MKSRRAVLTKQYHSDMARYLNCEPEEQNNVFIWFKPANVTNVWVKQAIARFHSFGIAAKSVMIYKDENNKYKISK